MNRPTAPLDLDDLIAAPGDSVRATLGVIDRGGLMVALVCDAKRKLVAVATDGDIRRHLIRGGSLDDPISTAANPRFTTVRVETPRSEVVDLMVDRGFNCVPVVDKAGKLVDVHTLRTALIGGRNESWAIVMAGGKGERLGALTEAIPKPMLPIGDKPILERIVRHLVAHGIRRIFISVSHFAKMIEDHFGDGSGFFCRIEYLREDRPLGTGGPIGLLPEKPKAPLVVMNGDLLTTINISRLLAFHRAGGFAATMALREHIVKVPFGVAELEGPRIARLVEKPSLNYRINAGIYVLAPDILGRVATDRLYPITELLESCLQEERGVGAYHMQEMWNDIGLPEEYARVHQS
jgi:dTDP-glucose pyrophosphorylase